MDQKQGRVSPLLLLSLGTSVFAMHFGTSSMIWPMTWGKQSGDTYLLAFAGVFCTAIGLVYLAYISLTRSGKSLYQMAAVVSGAFANAYSLIIILVMGPLFCIPRMAAAVWDAFLQVSGLRFSSFLPALLFSSLYCLITYRFISSENDVLSKISKWLVPFLLLAVTFVLVKGVLYPTGAQLAKEYPQASFAYGFKSGYASGEVICALLYGDVVIRSLNKVTTSDRKQRYLYTVCAIGLLLLTITHFCHMYIGSFTGHYQELSYARLYAQVVIDLWGPIGGVIFTVALTFAALTAAVGISSSTAILTVELSRGKLAYKKTARFILAITAIVASLKLDAIVRFIGPLLDIIYPATIVLVVYFALNKNVEDKLSKVWSLRFSVFMALLAGIVEGIVVYGNTLNETVGWHVNVQPIADFLTRIPLAEQGVFWFVPVLVAAVVGWLLGYCLQKKQASCQI